MIERKLEKLVQEMIGWKKAIVILGPRQVGKTTLLEKMFPPMQPGTLWFNGEDSETRNLFNDPSPTRLKVIFGDADTLVFDEAQRIPSIGLVIKMSVDNHPEKKILVTGSSALELAGGIQESMTGRKWELCLHPISFEEMSAHLGHLKAHALLEHHLRFGFYPGVINHAGKEELNLRELRNSYLYKDILAYQQVKKPAVLEKLLRALAHQIGNEVAHHELGQLVGLDPHTVERYIDLLEKAFIVFPLQALSRNMRNEIKKSRKIYFHDLGIRNAMITRFNPMEERDDMGMLWENFCIVERMKTLEYHQKYVNRYFWRTHTHQEIDYIEEYDGKLHAYEFKWNPNAKVKTQKTFLEAYPGTEIQVITPKNFDDFVMIRDKK
jgi:predicted AAA+ superfamily ATPase